MTAEGLCGGRRRKDLEATHTRRGMGGVGGNGEGNGVLK